MTLPLLKQLPLLDKRLEFLKQSGQILSSKYQGNIYNLLSKTKANLGTVAQQIAKNFPSFSDHANYNKQTINFYKRAQIFAYDISLLTSIKANNLDSLTAFADYKIPQTLRAFGAIKYKKPLAQKIDNYILLPNNSPEETEIRATTIWVCEILAHLNSIPPVLIDNALWKTSQSLKDVSPYHRTLTTNY